VIEKTVLDRAMRFACGIDFSHHARTRGRRCAWRPSRSFVSVVLGTSIRLAVFLVIALTIVYTFEGGMKAVIWTDVAQCLLYLAGQRGYFFLFAAPHPGRLE